MKKLLIALLSLLMLFCTAFAIACGGGDDNGGNSNQGGDNTPQPAQHPDFTFELTEDGTSYAITGIKVSFSDTTFEIPSIFDGKPVTEIRSGSYKSQQITSIIIPDSIITVGRGSFYGFPHLDSVTFGSNVKTIGINAFAGCPKITDVTLPSGLEYIDNQAFLGTSIAELRIPGSVKRIGERAFAENNSLTSVEFLDGVESIDKKAFINCRNLANVTLGDGLQYMGSEVFSGTHFQNNDLNYFENGNSLYLNDVLVRVKGYGEGSFTIKKGTRVIADRAISQDFDEINLPKSLEIYCNEAITSYYRLTAINAHQESEYFSTIDGNLYSKDGKTLIRFCGGNTNNELEYEVPTGITTIANGAFKGCKFKTLTVANDVITLGNAVFSEATIKNVILGAGITSIGLEGVSNIWQIQTFTFQGTVAQWEAIEKDERFYVSNNVEYIQCSDGQVINPYQANKG